MPEHAASPTPALFKLEELEKVVGAAEGGDLSRVPEVRKAFSTRRLEIMQALAKGEWAPKERDAVLEVLHELRLREDQFNSRIQAIQDTQHAQRMLDLGNASNAIAERLADAADSANTISNAAEATAGSLKRWTAGLVVATSILAAATIALVYATFRLAV